MAEIISAFNAHAPAVVRTLAVLELQLALLALLVWALDRRLRPATPTLRYGLWLLVLLKALLPPLWTLPPSAAAAAILENFDFLPVTAATTTTVPASLTAAGMLLAGWILAALAWLGLAVTRYLSLRRALRLAQPIQLPAGTADLSCAGQWPRLFRAEHLCSPLATGWWRPGIYLNDAALTAESTTLRALLCHELAHIRQRDSWVLLLQTLAQILHPFNPAIWLMNARLARYRELRCDDFALQQTAIAPRCYGEMLLHFLEAEATPRPLPFSAAFFEAKAEIKQRLTHLFSPKEADMKIKSWRQGLLFAALLLFLTAVSWNCRQEAQTPPQDLTAAGAHDLNAPDTEAGFDVAPAILTQAMPVYPAEARKAGVECDVWLQVRVSEQGRVEEVSVKKCDQPAQGFEEAAMTAMRQWTFKPATKNEKPVAAVITVPFKFKLQEKQG